MDPRHLVACLAVGAALSLLPTACLICDCAPPTCDTAHIALELPPGQSLTLRTTTCFDGLDPSKLDEYSPYGLALWFEGEDDDGYDDDDLDLTLAADGPDVTADEGYFSASAPYSQALCDDGLTVTLTNIGTAHVTGVVHLEVTTNEDGRRCELAVEQP